MNRRNLKFYGEMKSTKRNRKSIRLQSYDYSRPGYYFITICANKREPIFGRIEEGVMVLNELGRIANKYWLRMPIKYDGIRIPAYVVMPNHVHGIVQIISRYGQPVEAIHELPLLPTNSENYRKRRRQMYLSKIIGWYKMNVSRKINQMNNLKGSNCWQRNYYEHIIRNQESLNKITEYINLNPETWERDTYFQSNNRSRGNS